MDVLGEQDFMRFELNIMAFGGISYCATALRSISILARALGLDGIQRTLWSLIFSRSVLFLVPTMSLTHVILTSLGLSLDLDHVDTYFSYDLLC